MKTPNLKILIVLLITALLLNQSCKKDIEDFFNEQFPEYENMSEDIFIEGEVAVPVLNTYLTLSNFIPPKTDSSFWIGTDQEGIIHLRVYLDRVVDVAIGNIFDINPQETIDPDSLFIQSDTFKLGLYDNAIVGHVLFKNPKLKFFIRNPMPINCFFRLDTIRLHNGDTVLMRKGGRYQILGSSDPNNPDVTEIEMDDILNMEEFLALIPQAVSASVMVGSKSGILPGDFDNLTGDEKISADLDFDLPMDFKVTDLKLGDTVDFELDTTQNIEQIKEVIIKLVIDNDFPVNGLTQIMFADTNANGEVNNIIETLFDGDGWEFKSSIVNADGETTASVNSKIKLTISQEKIKKLVDNNACKLIVKTELNTPGNYVKIFGWYKIGIKLGLKVSYSGNTGSI